MQTKACAALSASLQDYVAKDKLISVVRSVDENLNRKLQDVQDQIKMCEKSWSESDQKTQLLVKDCRTAVEGLIRESELRLQGRYESLSLELRNLPNAADFEKTVKTLTELEFSITTLSH